MSNQQAQWATVTSASEADQWQFDRQQNIIDQIDASEPIVSPASSSEADIKTANKRRAEALAIQNYLIGINVESQSVNDAVDQADADWVATNPPPAGDGEPEVEPVD